MRNLFAAVLTLVLFATPTLAQTGSADGTIVANIIADVSITSVQNMTFPGSPAGAGFVQSNQVAIWEVSHTLTVADLYDFSFTLPATLADNGNTLAIAFDFHPDAAVGNGCVVRDNLGTIVREFVCSTGATGVLLPGNSVVSQVEMGGTIDVQPTTVPGTYLGTATLTMTAS